MGPLVRVEPAGILYTKVQPEDVPELVDMVLQGKVLERLPLSRSCYRERSMLGNRIPFAGSGAYCFGKLRRN